MTRERHNNIAMNVNSEAVQNKSWGINLQTLSSNVTPYRKLFVVFFASIKIKTQITYLFRGLIKMMFYNTDRHIRVRKSQAPYGINIITNFIKVPKFSPKILEQEKNPIYLLISLPFHSLHNKGSKL
jgi:hypothetical protein